LNFLDRLSKNTQICNFMKISSVGTGLFHADGQTGRSQKSLLAILRTRLKRLNLLLFTISVSYKEVSVEAGRETVLSGDGGGGGGDGGGGGSGGGSL
jgi:hypothetical protein